MEDFKHCGPLANDITAALEKREAEASQEENHAFWSSEPPEARAEIAPLKREKGMTVL